MVETSKTTEQPAEKVDEKPTADGNMVFVNGRRVNLKDIDPLATKLKRQKAEEQRRVEAEKLRELEMSRRRRVYNENIPEAIRRKQREVDEDFKRRPYLDRIRTQKGDDK